MAEASILVFGATGGLGRHTLDALRREGVEPSAVTAAGRNPSRLQDLSSAGYGTAAVDLSDPARVAEVVGHDKVVLISGQDDNRLKQHTTVIEAASNAGVGHLLYTSGLRVDEGNVFGVDHKATEDAIVASGLTYTILRNGWYIENYLPVMAAAAHTGTLAAAVGDAVVAAAGRSDFADAIAAVLTTDGHESTTYSLSGDTDFSYADIAAAMAAVLDRDIRYLSLSSAELLSALSTSGMDAATAAFLVHLDETLATGMFAATGEDLRRLIRRPTQGLIEVLRAGP